MTDPNARSCNGVRTSARSRDRHEVPPPAGPLRQALESGYVRLRASPIAPPREPAPLPSAPEDVGGSIGWSRLLEWCVSGSGIDGALLTDHRGLVIASAGITDPDVVLGIAARLVIAFQQADRMSTTASPAIMIQLDHGWLTGIRIDHDDEPLTVGVIARAPLDDVARTAVRQALGRKARVG